MGARAGRHHGGIEELLELVGEYRSAIRFDVAQLGIDLDQLLRDERWAVGVDLVGELQRESRSHLWAAQAGMKYAASMPEVAGIGSFNQLAAIYKAITGHKGKPAFLPSPFKDTSKPEITVADRAEADEMIEQYTSIR